MKKEDIVINYLYPANYNNDFDLSGYYTVTDKEWNIREQNNYVTLQIGEVMTEKEFRSNFDVSKGDTYPEVFSK